MSCFGDKLYSRVWMFPPISRCAIAAFALLFKNIWRLSGSDEKLQLDITCMIDFLCLLFSLRGIIDCSFFFFLDSFLKFTGALKTNLRVNLAFMSVLAIRPSSGAIPFVLRIQRLRLLYV
ncbi:hypothetical protein GQ43DRAFT_85520 [Delitschia confertaspora ATCC 74209]|uniref:Uncharacterized protein n=1 Tax=Delitschia confertaspora ATCC 74209 TaxID=1513339 RepID=A0A9P4MWD2_9PLEO|nr:hypothetical protein GQ43DRAFT_85520 [Delitschia confertaspora ATCC 74209]